MSGCYYLRPIGRINDGPELGRAAGEQVKHGFPPVQDQSHDVASLAIGLTDLLACEDWDSQFGMIFFAFLLFLVLYHTVLSCRKNIG